MVSRRKRGRFWKAVVGYKLRVLFNQPYKKVLTADEFRRYLPAGYPPCPGCGKRSLASITDHCCDECADFYQFCPQCVQVKDRFRY